MAYKLVHWYNFQTFVSCGKKSQILSKNPKVTNSKFNIETRVSANCQTLENIRWQTIVVEIAPTFYLGIPDKQSHCRATLIRLRQFI